MRHIDQSAIKEYRIAGSVLMERAGLSVATRIQEIFDKKKIVVLSGGGNNGGDGIVAGRVLHNLGWPVRVLLLLKQDRLSPECLSQYRIAKKSGVPIEFRNAVEEGDLHGAIVLDAMLGTGINKPVTSPMSDVIRFLNTSAAPVISVDIPSGVSSDNGQIMGEAVRADYTVTFGLPKIGHFLFPGADYTGKLFIEEIGFPSHLLRSDDIATDISDEEMMRALLPERPRFSHKGDYGHVLVVAGSRGKTGAALMAAHACMRSGAGMVTIGVPESLSDIFQSRVTEEMILPLPDTGNAILSRNAVSPILDFLNTSGDVLAIGPGLGITDELSPMIRELLLHVTSPTVVDADALNALASVSTDFYRRVRAPIIFTPHPGEMARLIKRRKGTRSSVGSSKEETILNDIESDRLQAARDFSQEHGLTLVLKGVPTIIAEPEGKACINPNGNAGMATAGAGDVLTGIVAALLGQGLAPFPAATLGAYLHGLAGDIASSGIGPHSLIASDIIETLPAAFLRLRNAADHSS